MYKLCKTQESALRQRQVEQGLLAAMKQQQYEEISVSDLCERLQIPRKTFYRYFDSKDGCLLGLIDHTLMEYAGFLPGRGQSLELELEKFFSFWRDNRALLDALQGSSLGGLLVERATNFALEDCGVLQYLLPEETRAVQVHTTIFWICGLLALVLSWHREGFQRSPLEMAKISARILSNPLIPEDKY